MKNLLSKKMFSAGGAMGGICYVASLVATGGLSVPVGLAFAGLLAAVSAIHVHVQGKLDEEKKKPPAKTKGKTGCERGDSNPHGLASTRS